MVKGQALVGVGDLVESFNEVTGESELKVVTAIQDGSNTAIQDRH